MPERVHFKKIDNVTFLGSCNLNEPDAAAQWIERGRLRVDADDLMPGNGFHGPFQGRLAGDKPVGRPAQCRFSLGSRLGADAGTFLRKGRSQSSTASLR